MRLQLSELGIEGQIKQTQDKLIVRPDVVAVLTMDKKQLDLARKIYAERNYAERNYEQNQIEPVIDLLGKIATGNDDIEVKTIFAEGKNPATLMLERLVDYVPKAIDKIIKIYN